MVAINKKQNGSELEIPYWAFHTSTVNRAGTLQAAGAQGLQIKTRKGLYSNKACDTVVILYSHFSSRQALYGEVNLKWLLTMDH